MRAIRVRAWVEVVGSVMELFHFRVQWNARNISRATLRECGEASSCQEANPMYEETDNSLSEGELESTWPCRNTKILQSSTKSRLRPLTMGKMGQTNHEAMWKGKPRQALLQGDESLCNLLESPLHWAGERKTLWGKPGERYKHRWGKVREASHWGPWKFRPSTVYGAFPPHTQWFIMSFWPLGG